MSRYVSYKKRWEVACSMIVELQEALRRERAMRQTALSRATLDELTRLHNRRAFNAEGRPRFHRAKRGKVSMAMLFIDVNAFKTVNDSLGHAIGDKLLVAIARTIRQCTRPSDLKGRTRIRNLAGRNGGDEFVLFLENIDEAGVEAVVRRTCTAVQAIQLREAPGLRPSVSIGAVVGVPSTDLKWSDLITQADDAMYEGKKLRGSQKPTICIRPITTPS